MSDSDLPRPDYDFSSGVRGKYAEAYARGTNLMLLDPDVAACFPTGESVNEALRYLMNLARRMQTPPSEKA